MVLLLIGMTGTWAQKKTYTITASGTCDVTICQADTLLVVSNDGTRPYSSINSGTINLAGTADYVITLPELDGLNLYGATDAKSQGTLKGHDLAINMAGSADAVLEVDYDNITVNLTGSSDLTLKGRCHSLIVTLAGVSSINTDNLKTDSVVMSMTGTSGRGDWKVEVPNIDLGWKRKNTLLYDADWNGFEAGLNILTPGVNHWNSELPRNMELRQMRSWCFNINIADVGIAFNKQHSIGLFTGIGIGWNNYCFVNPVYFWKGDDGTLHESPIVDDFDNNLNVDRSKIGVFYAQMPLMVEFMPFHGKMYIDLGVTGAMRVTSWQTIRFGDNPMSYAVLSEEDGRAVTMPADGTKYQKHRDLCVNFFKLDATMRIGSDDDHIGLFVNYALLPVFAKNKGPEVYPVSIGLSINF